MTHKQAKAYPPLSEETRSHVDTECASYHSGFAVPTLRTWASRGAGQLTPIRRGRKLAWSVAELRKLNGEAPPNKLDAVTLHTLIENVINAEERWPPAGNGLTRVEAVDQLKEFLGIV